MPVPTTAQGSTSSLLLLEKAPSSSLKPRQSLIRRFTQDAVIPKSLVAELAVFSDRPALAIVALMPIAAFMFVGLFLGELIGLLLGIYFAGINVIFLRNKAPSTRTKAPIAGPCLELTPEQP